LRFPQFTKESFATPIQQFSNSAIQRNKISLELLRATIHIIDDDDNRTIRAFIGSTYRIRSIDIMDQYR